MTVKREGTYVWATWLSKLMAGDISCEWAPWFRSHYQKYAKAPSDFDLATWQMRHTRLLRELRIEKQATVEQVLVEGQTQFYFKTPQSGLVVSGKPDLLAISGKTVEVCDCKTGQPRGSDGVQIMIYMYCIPRSKPELREKTFKGQIVYAHHRVDIPPSAINEEFEKNFGYFLHILDSDEPANKVPSARECKFCDIDKADCPERIDAPVEEE